MIILWLYRCDNKYQTWISFFFHLNFFLSITRINQNAIRKSQINTISAKLTNMSKCSLWKPETNNRTLPTRLTPMKGQQKEIQYSGEIRTLPGKDCEVENMIQFLREIDIFKETLCSQSIPVRTLEGGWTKLQLCIK